MNFVSIQPLLDALDRAAESTIEHFRDRVEIDRILVSSNLREYVVASAFVASDAELAGLEEELRGDIAAYLSERVGDEYARIPRELQIYEIGEGCHINWLSRDDLRRDYGGSYGRYMRG